MAPPRKERTRPCTNCKENHLKCDNDIPCAQCRKSQLKCHRMKKGFRFKQSAHAKMDLKFSKDQPWLQAGAQNCVSYVDETQSIAARASSTGFIEQFEWSSSPQQQPRSIPAEQEQTRSRSKHPNSLLISMHSDPPSRSQQSPLSPPLPSPSHRRNQHGTTPRSASGIHDVMAPASLTHTSPSTRSTMRLADGQSQSEEGFECIPSPILESGTSLATEFQQTSYTWPSPYINSPDALHGVPEGATDAAYTGLQEACLIRHFVENLAHSFDTTDPYSHYSLVVPQRAMYCPVLLYAICTASARHLTRLWYREHPNTVVEFNGFPLPDLDEESAIYYHNICISHLIDVSKDPSKSYNEDALAAATILRFYEQVDTSLTGTDFETYLSVVQGVINSQSIYLNDTFNMIDSVRAPPKPPDIYSTPAPSLRHSACSVALRQEIWAVLLHRRPFKLPLSSDNDYSQLSSADDFVWVNRILIWCADVLRFCFGSENSDTHAADSSIERWDALKAFEENWATLQPACFKPLHYAPPDPSRGQYFPRIWHMNDCQIIGLQHIELGRMLLLVYNPRRQRLGLGSSAINRALESQLRHSILRLCGLALSNKKFQGAMVTAALGVSLCGEHFHDPGEQAAVVEFMSILENEHAWPTKAVVSALQQAWSLQRISSSLSPPKHAASV